MVTDDERGQLIDPGNVRLVFDSLMEKAHGRERERQREEARRMLKLEQAFCEMLREATNPTIRADTSWEDISERFSTPPSFTVRRFLQNLDPIRCNIPFETVIPFMRLIAVQKLSRRLRHLCKAPVCVSFRQYR